MHFSMLWVSDGSCNRCVFRLWVGNRYCELVMGHVIAMFTGCYMYCELVMGHVIVVFLGCELVL